MSDVIDIELAALQREERKVIDELRQKVLNGEFSGENAELAALTLALSSAFDRGDTDRTIVILNDIIDLSKNMVTEIETEAPVVVLPRRN